jgi:hypothetical protein
MCRLCPIGIVGRCATVGGGGGISTGTGPLKSCTDSTKFRRVMNGGRRLGGGTPEDRSVPNLPAREPAAGLSRPLVSRQGVSTYSSNRKPDYAWSRPTGPLYRVTLVSSSRDVIPYVVIAGTLRMQWDSGVSMIYDESKAGAFGQGLGPVSGPHPCATAPIDRAIDPRTAPDTRESRSVR